jgi:DNA-binding NarL/FixJ family response regulator
MNTVSKMKKIRVLLVDDHKIMRQGLRRLVELDGGLEVVGEAETGEEALAEVRAKSPDIVLMDIRIPGVDGIEATRQIKQSHPRVEVIMLTSYVEEYMPEAIEAGASGYLLKSVGYEELSNAIRAVHSGEVIIDRSLGRELFRRFADLTRASKESALTERELEILSLLASGMSGRQIAAQLFISETTLKRELRHTFNKLGVDNRAQAIAEACKRELL